MHTRAHWGTLGRHAQHAHRHRAAYTQRGPHAYAHKPIQRTRGRQRPDEPTPAPDLSPPPPTPRGSYASGKAGRCCRRVSRGARRHVSTHARTPCKLWNSLLGRRLQGLAPRMSRAATCTQDKKQMLSILSIQGCHLHAGQKQMLSILLILVEVPEMLGTSFIGVAFFTGTVR